MNPATLLARPVSRSQQLSPHFTAGELACRCCGKLYITPNILEMLERLRQRLGCPIIVSSGYRCPEHNAEIGGALHSKHMLGMAADILLTNDTSIERFSTACRAVAREVNGGFHYYERSQFAHIDCWAYPGNRRW